MIVKSHVSRDGRCHIQLEAIAVPDGQHVKITGDGPTWQQAWESVALIIKADDMAVLRGLKSAIMRK